MRKHLIEAQRALANAACHLANYRRSRGRNRDRFGKLAQEQLRRAASEAGASERAVAQNEGTHAPRKGNDERTED